MQASGQSSRTIVALCALKNYILAKNDFATRTFCTIRANDTHTVFIVTRLFPIKAKLITAMSLGNVGNFEATNIVVTIPIEWP
jgi:hypothetical protein